MKQKYQVPVIVHRQTNRTWETTVEVEAATPDQAKFIAEGEAERLAADVDFNQFGESSCHYEAEAGQPQLIQSRE
jgi:hypothetical protein